MFKQFNSFKKHTKNNAKRLSNYKFGEELCNQFILRSYKEKEEAERYHVRLLKALWRYSSRKSPNYIKFDNINANFMTGARHIVDMQQSIYLQLVQMIESKQLYFITCLFIDEPLNSFEDIPYKSHEIMNVLKNQPKPLQGIFCSEIAVLNYRQNQTFLHHHGIGWYNEKFTTHDRNKLGALLGINDYGVPRFDMRPINTKEDLMNCVFYLMKQPRYASSIVGVKKKKVFKDGHDTLKTYPVYGARKLSLKQLYALYNELKKYHPDDFILGIGDEGRGVCTKILNDYYLDGECI